MNGPTILFFVFAWWVGLSALSPPPIGPASNVARFLAMLVSAALLLIGLARLA